MAYIVFPSCIRNIPISPTCLCVTSTRTYARKHVGAGVHVQCSVLCCIVNEGGHLGTSPGRRRGGTNDKGFPARPTTHGFTSTLLTKQEAGSNPRIVHGRNPHSLCVSIRLILFWPDADALWQYLSAFCINLWNEIMKNIYRNQTFVYVT